MDFKRNCPRKAVRIRSCDQDDLLFAHKVCLYQNPLLEDITIQELEEYTHERLKLYAIFEKLTNSTSLKIDIITSLKGEKLSSYLLLFGYVDTINETFTTEAIRRDNVSHFFLRYVFCQSSDLKRYFLQKEKDIFRAKFAALSKKDIEQSLKTYNINCNLISKFEKEELLKKDLLQKNVTLKNIYRIHFVHALPLVKLRRCLLHKGQAFVEEKDLVDIFLSKLQDEIEYGLQIACKFLAEMEEDDRIHNLLNNLRTTFNNRLYILKNDKIPIESIDEISVKSFPLCMRVAHDYLRKKHHHKYIGRLQYGLFLKGIGVTLEDSLRFWREEFIKRIEPERFDKRYAYGIRYNYGIEGRRKNCPPYSCNKIFSKNVGFNDTHGCPFQMYDPPELKKLLLKYNLTADEVQQVVNYAYKGLPKVACRCYFNIKHETKLEISIENPNQYFELSNQIYRLRISDSVIRIQNYDDNLNSTNLAITENENFSSKDVNSIGDKTVNDHTHDNTNKPDEFENFELFEYINSSSDES